MATEAQLRRQIAELRREIDNIQQSSRSRERELRQQMTTNIRAAEERMRAEMRRRQQETEEEYTARVRRLQQEYAEQTARELRKVQEQAETALRLQREKFAELQRCNRELLALLEQTREMTERADEAQKSRAMQFLQEMEAQRRAAEGTPHGFFFDGEFEIIDARANGIEAQLKSKMYQAAAAEANAASLQFQLLSLKVVQAVQEWTQAFNDYRSLMYLIQSRIEQLEQYIIQTQAGRFNMSPAELEFWSSETYLEFRKKIREAMALIRIVEEKGILNYLKECTDESRRAIFGKVRDAREWCDEFTSIANCILTERVMSDERWALGALVKNELYERGSNVKVRRFRRTAAGGVVFPNNSNPLDCYDLVMSVQGLDDISVTFCPVRQDGVTVRNECLVSANPSTICEPEFVNRIINGVVECIREIVGAQEKNMTVIGIPFSEQSERIKRAEESSQKKKPDPQQQLKIIQKKYY